MTLTKPANAMRNLILFFLFIGFISTSCTNVYFENPQPQKGQQANEIPSEYHGTFVGNISTTDNLDTVYIKATTIKHHKNLFEIGKNMELRKTKDYFWVNLKANNGHWAVISAYPAKPNMLEVKPLRFTKGKAKKAAQIADVKQIGEDEYLMNPSKRQMKKLFKKGIFNEKVILKRLKD